MKQLILIGLLAFSQTFVGCSHIEKFFSNETVQKVAWNAVKVGVNLAMSYAAEEFPEYSKEILMARESINISYNIVFSDVGGDGQVSPKDIATNISKSLAMQITDPKKVDLITDVIAKHLFGLSEPAVAGTQDYDPEAIKAVAKNLSDRK